MTGLEPATSGVTGRRSNQLSYTPGCQMRAFMYGTRLRVSSASTARMRLFSAHSVWLNYGTRPSLATKVADVPPNARSMMRLVMIKTLKTLRPGATRMAAMALLTSLVSACATNFSADVTRFQQLPQPSGETVEVAPKNPSEAENLSFKQYAQIVGNHLGQVGYNPPVAGTPSTLIATIDYGVSSGPAPATVKKSSPVTIGIGVGTASRHSAFGVGMSTGVGEAKPEPPVTNRWLKMTIRRRSDGQVLYEGTASSLGEGRNLNLVMPQLVQALFKDFPGKNGTTNHVELGPEPKPGG